MVEKSRDHPLNGLLWLHSIQWLYVMFWKYQLFTWLYWHLELFTEYRACMKEDETQTHVLHKVLECRTNARPYPTWAPQQHSSISCTTWEASLNPHRWLYVQRVKKSPNREKVSRTETEQKQNNPYFGYNSTLRFLRKETSQLYCAVKRV